MTAAAAAVVFACFAMGASADDAVGIFRCEADGDAPVPFSFPFTSFGDGKPGSFLSGNFASGDGEGGGGDSLLLISTNGVAGRFSYSPTGWQGDAGGVSPGAARPGDTLVFYPAAGSDGYEFFVYGRVPDSARVDTELRQGLNLASYGYPSEMPQKDEPPNSEIFGGGREFDWRCPFWVSNTCAETVLWTRQRPYDGISCGVPRIQGMEVARDGTRAFLDIITGGRAVDVFTLRSGAGFSRGGWEHAARLSCGGAEEKWRDMDLAGAIGESGALFYMVADARRDTDADGLSDGLEKRVFGTNPDEADSDGDGTPDGLEVAWGTSPRIPGGGHGAAWEEGFERPGTSPGDVHGQNGWKVRGNLDANVQTGVVHSGESALMLCGVAGGGGIVSRQIATDSDTVWLDMHMQVHYADGISSEQTGTAAFAVNRCGHAIARDGNFLRTNTVQKAEHGTWVRATCRMDYSERSWDLYINGMPVFTGLAMGDDAPRMSAIEMHGAGGVVDGIRVTYDRPMGLSADGDAMPDEWEFSAFGTLGRDGSGDFDGDGVADADEWVAGCDPIAADTDGDGAEDGAELENGLSPTDPEDAAADSDGDGMSNREEIELGTDPGFWEPDPRRAMPGLRGEYVFTGGGLTGTPDYSSMDKEALHVAETISFRDDGWPYPAGERGDNFAVKFNGFILIPSSGVYTFWLTSDDGAELLVDGQKAAGDPTPHSAYETSGHLRLEAGWHPIELRYYENTGESVLSLSWSGPGIPKGTIPADALCHYPENLPPKIAAECKVAELVEGDDAEIEVSAHDADGDIVSISLFIGDKPAGSAEMPNASFRIASMPAGEHEFRAIATDNTGAEAESIFRFKVDSWPKGYVPGLRYAYYRTPGGTERMPDRDQLVPVSTGEVRQVAFLPTTHAWDGVPADLTNNFAASFWGTLWVKEAGRYVLSLDSDDGSRLWVDGQPAVDNDGAHAMTAKSAEIELAAGLHDILIEHYENAGEAGLMFSWGKTGEPLEPVAQSRLFHAAGKTDSDGDGLPDWWEDANGTNPDSAADSTADPDGDGVDNRTEFAAGTNPNFPDTDNDGLSDLWEAANGTKGYMPDAAGDYDGDGLNNLEEYLAGTNPGNADSDGDGCQDSIEIQCSRGDPLSADIYWDAAETLAEISATNGFAVATGRWRTDTDGGIYALGRAGSLTWRLSVPSGPPDALAVRVTEQEFYSTAKAFDLSLHADGLFAGRQKVAAAYGTCGEAYFFLPDIPAGEHEFRLTWHNRERNSFLCVKGLRFVRFAGPDENVNGIADWRDHRNETASGFEGVLRESLVSPLCVEGNDVWRDILEIGAEYSSYASNAIFAAVKTVGDGFYCDIPLAETGTTRIGFAGRSQKHTFTAVWKDFDVFREEFATNALSIRTGDSLMISGEGTVKVSRQCGEAWSEITNWVQSAAKPYLFENSGLHLVSVKREVLGLFSETCHGLVEVVRSRFPKRRPALIVGVEQKLGCPELSPQSLIEHDAALELSVESGKDGSVELRLATASDREVGMVSRLNEGGAICDAVQAIPIWADNGDYYHVAKTYPDGSQLVEVSLQFGALAEDISVRLEIFVSGVSFADGTRSKTLTASDFDENGHYCIRFIKARGVTTSVCHRTYIMQGGEQLHSNQ